MKNFISALKRAWSKRNTGMASKTAREMRQLLDANFQGA
jgi:hypothetical protein